ncbi:phosphoribosyl 1,2-cyclic phosphodiesterase [Fusobacterium naviforme]|uniref:Phosphoribosyl 1,2-cyclic phosphodiesterase n=1 Tax=Moryella indoligenes TaxID=371674 RepID=A0AAE3VA71_9FIRM|nr:MBL fold metallo-hydrolase [Moryella indoligenes]KAB0577990.1 MBL fold metallo-hydrolase [Fusobacterium naviforme]MDQ0152377.1 phosphoribosyl 1,2-cyclic phosphodiesterase [Moryella indoligenes]PSL10789.1 phosphoribosyl 1,2-cyclic phosphodiesterase [Fusobacterium naviforme]STO27347.1 putative hydrolase [Fusobacterium naviforme]
MRFVSIASGSSGNSIYVGTSDTHILVDAGISNRRIERGLGELGVKADELSALVVTHEHSDHVKGLTVLMKKHHVPLFATAGTVAALKRSCCFEGCDEELIHIVRAEERFSVGDMELLPFSIDHDAAEPVAYRIESGGRAVAVATDMGHYTEQTVARLERLDALLLESNHDVRMLEAGPYPYSLKRRILGNFGHLSNESAGKLLTEILHDGLKQILLGHLSKENNIPELAYETVRCEIGAGDCPYGANDFPIAVAQRDCRSEIYEF